MRAAALASRDIPKLCATDRLKAFGSCRLCLVEIDGRRGFPASCTTLVAEGMKVRTESPSSPQLRRNVMELYVSDHPLDCLTCPANGHCELQDMAERLDVTSTRYGLAGSNDITMASSTRAIPTSSSISPSASSARVACARATRCRAPLR